MGPQWRYCNRGGWLQATLVAFAKYKGLEVASFFSDLAKFYEQVEHEILAREGSEVGFPTPLLTALLGFYSCDRALSYNGACSVAFSVPGTILAGCSCATTCAKVVLHRLLLGLVESYSGLFLVNVVDDCSLTCLGSARYVTDTMSRAVRQFTSGMADLRLPLAAEKTVFQASKGVAKQLGAEWVSRGFSRKRSHRNLGIDAAEPGVRAAPTQRERLRKARGRARKLLRWRSSTAKLAFIHRAGCTATALWGASVRGISPTPLRGLRAAAVRSVARFPRGARLELKLGLLPGSRSWDPAAVHFSDVIFQWCQAVWLGEPGPQMLEQVWRGARLELARPGSPWRRARDPGIIYLLTLRSLGWQAHSATKIITERGRQLDLRRLSPKAVALLARESLATQSDIGSCRRIAPAGWWGPISWKALRGARASLEERQANSLASLVAGPSWTQAKLAGAGLADSDVCQVCHAARGTLHHRAFGCWVGDRRRQEYNDPLVLEAAAAVLEAGEDTGELFARGILPFPADWIPGPLNSDEAEVKWINKPPDGLLKGQVFGDGSSYFAAQHPALARAGWSLVSEDRFGNLVSAAYGAVPIDRAPLQRSNDGEDYALFMAASLCDLGVDLWFDCAGTISTARAGPAVATAARHAGAHLWGHIFCCFEESLPNRLHKTLGHATWSDVEEGKSTHWERLGNSLADKWAKRGAMLHGFDETAADEIRALLYFQERVCKFLGDFAAWHTDSGLRDHTELVGRIRERAAAQAAPVTLGGLTAKMGSILDTTWREEVQEADAAAKLQCALGHRLRAAACRAPFSGSILLCTKCGGYSQHRLALLGRECRGARKRSAAATRRINRFLSGRHPFFAEGLVGTHWHPPAAISGRLLERMGGDCMRRSGCDEKLGLSSAGLPAEASYRQAILKSCGLTEAMLAQLRNLPV